MTDRNAHLSAFIDALMAHQPHLFERTVKVAYEAGSPATHHRFDGTASLSNRLTAGVRETP